MNSSSMKKFLFISMALLLACVAWAQNDSNDIVKVGDSMPTFTIVHDNGTQWLPLLSKGKLSGESVCYLVSALSEGIGSSKGSALAEI